MKNKKIRALLKDIADGLVLGLVVTGMFVGAVKINAAGADTELPEEYRQYCEEIGQEYNICPELLMAVIEEESGGDENAVGKYGEVGLMQVYPKYHMDRAERLGVNNLFDPENNIRVGADYLAEMFAEYGDAGTVLMAYNGVLNAGELGEKGEYTSYAKEVIKRTEQLERLHKK